MKLLKLTNSIHNTADKRKVHATVRTYATSRGLLMMINAVGEDPIAVLNGKKVQS